MSAYIVGDLTIHRIVTHLSGDHENQHWFKKLKDQCNIDPRRSEKERNALASLMLSLNIRAVNERYKDKQTAIPGPFVPYPCTRIQAYTSLKCWLYQCGEGTVTESELLQLMTEYSHRLAEEIVRALPEYAAGEWN